MLIDQEARGVIQDKEIQMDGTVRGPFLVVDPDLVAEGHNLPAELNTYVLIDNDAKVCRVIKQDEFDASFVDNNIQTYQLQDVNWLTLDVDNHNVTLTYTSGAQAVLLLGSIDLNGSGTTAAQYGQSNGIIYPIDDGGAALLDATNTPNLVRIRTWYLNEAQRVNDQRIQMAEVVHAFSENIAGLSGAGGD
jgi:hypothetical protein